MYQYSTPSTGSSSHPSLYVPGLAKPLIVGRSATLAVLIPNTDSKLAVSVICTGLDHVVSCGYLPSDENTLEDAHNIADPLGIESDQPSVSGLGEL